MPKETYRKLRVMRVLPDLNNGGLQRATLDFLDNKPDNIDLMVAAVVNGGLHQKDFEDRCITVVVGHEDGDPFRSYLWFKPGRIIRLALAMRKLRPDVVQTHTFPSAVVGRTAAKLAGVPVIIDVLHNTYTWKQPKDLRIDRWLSHITDSIVCSSYAVRDYALEQNPGIPKNKYQVIYDGIDTKRFHPRNSREDTLRRFGIASDRQVVGSVSRMVKQKRIADVVNAAPAVLKRYPNAHFIIAGNGPTYRSIEDQIKKMGLTDCFTLTGVIHDTEHIYPMLDVFVQPAEREGFGLSNAEAMASGIAVVAAKAGAVPEVVTDQHNGLLYEAGDIPALADKICLLLGDAKVRQRLGNQAAKDIPDRFSFDNVPFQYAEIWSYLLASKRRGIRYDSTPQDV